MLLITVIIVENLYQLQKVQVFIVCWGTNISSYNYGRSENYNRFYSAVLSTQSFRQNVNQLYVKCKVGIEFHDIWPTSLVTGTNKLMQLDLYYIVAFKVFGCLMSHCC